MCIFLYVTYGYSYGKRYINVNITTLINTDKHDLNAGSDYLKALHMLAEDNDYALPLASTLTPGAIGRMHGQDGPAIPQKVKKSDVNVTPEVTPSVSVPGLNCF